MFAQELRVHLLIPSVQQAAHVVDAVWVLRREVVRSVPLSKVCSPLTSSVRMVCGSDDLHDLTRLKAAHPDRVHLVLGNRDINKMRFLHELSSGRVAQGLRAQDPRHEPSRHEGWTALHVAAAAENEGAEELVNALLQRRSGTAREHYAVLCVARTAGERGRGERCQHRGLPCLPSPVACRHRLLAS